MKYFFLLFISLQTLLFANTGQEITNDTEQDMICSISYQSIVKEELIHGIMQRVQVEKQELFTKILKPRKTLKTKRDANLVCYNEFAKISSYKAGNNTRANERSLKQFIKSNEMFDISSYINENKEFIDLKYNPRANCKKYKDGQYCQIKNGLDIFYTKKDRVKKIFIYGSAVSNYRQNLNFSIESFNKLRTTNGPLGLWVSKKNKKLIKAKPDFFSDNAIIWKNPNKGIKSIVMTSKNGHLNIHSYSIKKKDKIKQDSLNAIEIEYVLDDKAYALHQKTRPMPVTNERNGFNRQQKAKIPRKAKTTWGKELNPKNTIPTGKFQAFYINTNNPKKVIFSETVKKASINYNGSEFQGIKSEDFGAYWVGNFKFKKTEKMQVIVSQSWSKTRVIIDGIVIYEDGHDSKGLTYTFTKGTHKIEVEYINNWHTTSFMLSIKKQVKTFTISQMQKELKKHTSKNSKLLYVGAYESSKKDQSITLKIAKSKKPIVLVLSTYSTVDWIIKNPHKVKIEAIVYTSYEKGVGISGDISKETVKLPYKGRNIGSYSMKRTCSCINGGAVFNCSGTDGLHIISSVESLTGKKLSGISTKYSLDTVMVPNIIIDKKFKKELKENKKRNEKMRKECQQKSNPEFENMFDK